MIDSSFLWRWREQHFGRAADAGRHPADPVRRRQATRTDHGRALVVRASRFQGFTPEGERVLEWARRIVADSRAMRQEVSALKRGLTGRLRMAAIPTALAMIAALTTPYRSRHPAVRFTVLSRKPLEVLSQLENLEIDAGITYVDNEPLGRVTAIPLYRERYRLATSSHAPLGGQPSDEAPARTTLSSPLIGPYKNAAPAPVFNPALPRQLPVARANCVGMDVKASV